MRIHHLALRTDDLAALERFYAGILGLAITRKSPHSIWLDAAGTILMLEQRDTAEPRIDPATKELFAFTVTPAEREQLATTLGDRIEARTDFTLYFRDPDGRRVGVSSYPDP